MKKKLYKILVGNIGNLIIEHYLLLFFLVFSSVIFSQNDTTEIKREPIDLAPRISIVPSTISLTEIVQKESYIKFVPVIFFSDDSDSLSQEAIELVRRLATALRHNPDMSIILRGYYSASLDEIKNPMDGIPIVDKRAEAVRQTFVAANPILIDRVSIGDGYDISASFLSEPSSYDRRVEMMITLPFSSRSIYTTKESPYIRLAYRKIIDRISARMDTVLSRNPDVRAAVIADGNPWSCPLSESYRRLDRIRSALAQKVGERVLTYIAQGESHPKSVTLNLLYAPLCADPHYRTFEHSSFSFADADSYLVVFMDWDRDYPIGWWRLFLVSDLLGTDRISISGSGAPPDTIFLFPRQLNGFAPFIGEHTAKLTLYDLSGVPHISKGVSLNVESDSPISLGIEFPIAFFYPGTSEPMPGCASSIWDATNAIANLVEFDDRSFLVTVKGISESDSLARLHADYIWNELLAQLIFRLDVKDADKISPFLSKRGVAITLEAAKPINGWSDRTTVLIEFIREK